MSNTNRNFSIRGIASSSRHSYLSILLLCWFLGFDLFIPHQCLDYAIQDDGARDDERARLSYKVSSFRSSHVYTAFTSSKGPSHMDHFLLTEGYSPALHH